MRWARRPRPTVPYADSIVELGYAVCNGVDLVIRHMELRSGQIMLHCVTPGPGNYRLEGPVTLYGLDGRGVLQGGVIARTETRNGHACIVLPLGIVEVIEP